MSRTLSDDDEEYFCRVILASEGIRFVPESRALYRISGSSRLSHVGQSDKKKDALLLSMHFHVKYLRSPEESDRTRSACLTFLKNSLIHFYPERPDIVEKLEELAEELA